MTKERRAPSASTPPICLSVELERAWPSSGNVVARGCDAVPCAATREEGGATHPVNESEGG